MANTGLVLLGATGDLAGRFLLPALARSRAAGRIPPDLPVVAAGQEDWDDERFREHAAHRLNDHAPDLNAPDRRALVDRLRYHPVDFADPGSIRRAVHGLTATTATAGPGAGARTQPPSLVVYLALPPRLFPPAIRALGEAGLAPGSRIAVEKPFGEDLDAAIALNALLSDLGDQNALQPAFRVDHALGMPAVGELMSLREGADTTVPVWDGTRIRQVDIVWEETLALEGRADFFDRAGALRDVMQNHMLQLLALVAMEPPSSASDEDLHRAKIEALRAVRPLAATDLASRTRRARYTAGRLVGTGTAVPDYAREHGVDPARATETYAEMVLEIDRPRWVGTRFVLRAGKALAHDRKGILLHLTRPAGPDGPGGGRVWIDLDAPGQPGAGPDCGPAGAPVEPVSGEALAYQAVLLDVLTGGNRLSVSRQESEQTWRIVEPVLAGWAREVVPLLEYPAGSAGPGPLPV